MILDRLILHNFGIYRGRHVFELTPLPGKPVVLFIGLNGAGKTTILTALQLAFYGRSAQPVTQAALVGGYTWEDYLGDCINYEEPAADSASIEVEFRATREGVEQRLLVRRSWRRMDDTGVSDRIEVFADDQPEPALAAAWSEVVEDLLPLKLSTLFFFDGEKIEQWANWEAASELISEAVHSLLGLDVIDRAITDLSAVEDKATAALVPDESLAKLHELRARVESLKGEREKVVAQAAECRNAVERAENGCRELEKQLVSRGIPLLDQRAELHALRDAATARLEAARAAERQRRMDNERSRRDRERFGEILRQRDAAMLAAAPAKVRAWLETWQRKQATEDFRVPLPEDDAPAPAGSFSATEKALTAEIRRLDGLLERMPDEAVAAEFLQKRAVALRELERARFRAEEVERLLAGHDSALAPEVARMERLADEARRSERAHEAASRHAATATAALAALRTFRERLIEGHCATLGRQLSENFSRLLHKTQLFDSARIVPGQHRGRLVFRLVVEKGGRPVDPYRFSAGESQMLALSLLWALAQSSGRRAPVVIDTPLARLDSAHRANVASVYLPNASEQVVVLATDDEANSLPRSAAQFYNLGASAFANLAA